MTELANRPDQDFELAMASLRAEVRAAVQDHTPVEVLELATDAVMAKVRPGYAGLWSSCEYHSDVSVSWRREAERLDQLRVATEQRLGELEAENADLKAAIADIDAHATPVGLLNEDDPDGSPHHYAVTVGALHRALGKAYTAEPCDAERERLRGQVHGLEERVAEQRDINLGWARYGERVKADRAQYGDMLIDALGITEPVGRWFEMLVPQVCAELEHQRSSRQDWAAEAGRLDHLRGLLAAAAQLPVDVPDDVLLAEIRARFDGVVRAVVGHAFVAGSPECECGAIMPTGLDWVDHVEALRADGVPTATIAAGGDR